MTTIQDLPPEILRRIYEYAIPHGLKLSFKEHGMKRNGESPWYIYAGKGTSERKLLKPCQLSTHKRRMEGQRCECKDKLIEAVYTAGALPQVSKSIAAEARAIFFSRNIFAVTIDGKPHQPMSLKSPLIFGPLGLPHRLHLLRDLRQLELDIIVDDILRQHGEDENKRSLLKRLHVRFGLDPYEEQLWDWWNRNRGLLVLEPLAALTGIEEVRITSQWPIDWFKQCLTLRIRGDGDELEELEWPMKTIKRVKPRDQPKRPGKNTVSTWKTGSPTLDWLTFAQRNGIEVPADLQIKYPKTASTNSDSCGCDRLRNAMSIRAV